MKFILMLIMVFPIFSQSIHQIEYEKWFESAEMGEPEKISFDKYIKTQPKGMKFTYYGYLPYWIDTTAYLNFQYELLTHIAYFSVSINSSDGSLGSVLNPSRFSNIYQKAKSRGIMMHMTYTIFGSSSVSSFLNNKTARDNAINNILNFVSDYNLDGVNIDFEYATLSVKDSFNLFINELNNALKVHADGRKELYIAMPCVPSWYPGYDFNYLSLNSDGLFIMTYDYHYSGSSEAGPVAPTYNSAFWGYYAVNTSIGDIIEQNVHPSKIILGIPYYGYDWPTESDQLKSKTTGSGSAVVFRNAKSNASTHGRRWDNNSYTPYYIYFSTSWHQCWYDDSLSIKAKLEISKDSILQGAGCWALGYDDGEGDIWNMIRQTLWEEPPSNHFTVEVNTAGLNIRKGPSISYDILSTAAYGNRFTVFDYKDSWYKIYYPSAEGNYYAWVNGGNGITTQYLKGATQQSIIRVNASLLNVRSGSSTDSSIITRIAKGQCFVADSFDGSWARIFIHNDMKGWCYYSTYSTVHNDVEDYNAYQCTIDSVVYPDTVYSGDIIEVYVYLKNEGMPFDSLVFLKSEDKSRFFYDKFWIDSSNAKTMGFDGIANQRFFRYSYFLAPSVDTMENINENFNFYRKGAAFSQSINFDITVIPKSSSKKSEQEKNDEYIINRYSLTIYDITGRKIFETKNNIDSFNKNILKTGIYFFVEKKNNSITKNKITIIR